MSDNVIDFDHSRRRPESTSTRERIELFYDDERATFFAQLVYADETRVTIGWGPYPQVMDASSAKARQLDVAVVDFTLPNDFDGPGGEAV